MSDVIDDDAPLDISEDRLKSLIRKVPQVALGEEFESQTWEVKGRYLKKLASSLNHALDVMQKERNDLRDVVAARDTEITNLQDGLAIQKSIVVQTITEQNQERQDLLEKIRQLNVRVIAQDSVIEKLNGNDSRLAD